MSAVVNDKSIETIFDHHVSDAELLELFYGYPEPYNEYVEGLSTDSLLVDIARLYQLRGVNDIANQYIEKISDEPIRSELLTTSCCKAHS